MNTAAMRLLVLFCLVFLSVGLCAQDLPAAEPPAETYQRAMLPVDIVRRSPNNVTDSEIAAWGVAVTTAAHACAAHKIEDFSAEDLFHYARLCQLGQQYDDAADAARKYLRDGNTSSAESARALIARAYLSSGNTLQAERAAYDLLRNHPYDGTVHTLVQEVVMALAATDAVENALALVQERSASLLDAARVPGGLALHEGTYRVPQSVLVRDALAAVYLYREENYIAGAPRSAEKLLDVVRQIIAGLPAAVSPLEREAMQAALRRAQLLDEPAPALTASASSLAAPAAKLKPAAKRIAESQSHPAAGGQAPSHLGYDGRITLLAFYVPWSPQRKSMYALLHSIARDYKTFPVQIFAVSTPATATGDASADPADVLEAITAAEAGAEDPVPTIVVPDQDLTPFAVDDWPTFALVDTTGKVRFLDTLTGSEYKDGGRMHRLLAALASQAGPLPPSPEQKQAKPRRVFVPAGKLQRRTK